MKADTKQLLNNFDVEILSNSSSAQNRIANKKMSSFLKKEIQLINVATKTAHIAIDQLTFKNHVKSIWKKINQKV